MKIHNLSRWILAACIGGMLMSGAAAYAQEAAPKPPEPPKEDYVKSHYTKYEYRIPMRDGKRLFTSVYVPKDTSQPYPILIDRTPYSVGPYGEDQYKKQIGPFRIWKKRLHRGHQDVRGRYMSGRRIS